MQRELAWHGARNARDLGGLPTSLSPTGATIPGRLARSARRESMTAQGWSDAADWGLRSIIDLRTAAEVGPREGDADAAQPSGITVTLAPTEDHENTEFCEVCFPILDSPAYWEHNVRILPGLVRATLQSIADAEPGILFHCAAGRDRTGMISTLLLANAGVPAEVIVEDYALAVRTMAGSAAHGGPTQDRQAGWTSAETTAFLADAEPFALAFAASAASVLDRLELSEGTRVRLRELLTA